MGVALLRGVDFVDRFSKVRLKPGFVSGPGSFFRRTRRYKHLAPARRLQFIGRAVLRSRPRHAHDRCPATIGVESG
jgi:hypothetical protein